MMFIYNNSINSWKFMNSTKKVKIFDLIEQTIGILFTIMKEKGKKERGFSEKLSSVFN